jgi:hypothetical protein
MLHDQPRRKQRRTQPRRNLQQSHQRFTRKTQPTRPPQTPPIKPATTHLQTNLRSPRNRHHHRHRQSRTPRQLIQIHRLNPTHRKSPTRYPSRQLQPPTPPHTHFPRTLQLDARRVARNPFTIHPPPTLSRRLQHPRTYPHRRFHNLILFTPIRNFRIRSTPTTDFQPQSKTKPTHNHPPIPTESTRPPRTPPLHANTQAASLPPEQTSTKLPNLWLLRQQNWRRLGQRCGACNPA